MAPNKPAYDPELAVVLEAFPAGDITPESIPALRKMQNDAANLEITLSGNEPFTHQEKTFTGPNGPVTISLFYPKNKATTPRPAIYHMHSGGMICGNRFTFFKDPLRWSKAAGAVAITVEYRLAPENPFPAGLNDCYAGLQYVAEHAAELGLDADRLMVSGQSAGANLAAAVAIMARDRKGPKLCGMLLDCGMYDDRGKTASINQYVKDGTWTRGSNETAWTAILGSQVGKTNVDPLAAVARQTNLGDLPPAYLSVGSAEGFRDENVELAKKIWAAGGQAEVHVWPGGYHCFDMLAPDAAISKACIQAKVDWARKTLNEPLSKL